MDDDKFALVEKIIKDINNVMSKNPDLCAFDIIPVDSNFRNKSPVLHDQNCLGLESWSVKHVYIYSYNELMDKYFAKSKRKSSKPNSVNSERLTILLNVTLLINPELSTLWNKRREMVKFQLLEKISELQFTKLLLSRKPKCNDVFSYRRWLLEEILQGDEFQPNNIDNLVNEELRVCEQTSERSPNNYHSWNHRMWVINMLKQRMHYNIELIFIKEYGFSERWASKHVSDFSCFHYRQFCIKNFLTINNTSWKNCEGNIDVNLRKSLVSTILSSYPKESSNQISEDSLIAFSEEQLVNFILSHVNKTCNCDTDYVLVCRHIQVLFYELALNNELLKFYKHHETLWYHRRFIVHEIVSLMYEYFGFIRINGALVKKSCRKCNQQQMQSKIVRYDCNRIYSSILFNVLISHEKKFVDERRNDGDNYADRHEKHMKFVEGLNNVM